MAQRHQLAGQFCKTEATNRFWRIIIVLLVLGALASVTYGFVWGFFWSRTGPLFSLVPLFVFAGIFMLIRKRVDPYLDRVAKERVRFMRGGQAEALIAWLLEDLDNNWHIFNCVKLESDSDIDHVVVGPGGLFCISTKSHRGHFVGTADGLSHNGEPSSFASEAMGQTMQLTKRLTALMGDDVPWVQSVLAVPFGYTDGDARGGKVWLVHQEDILKRLAPDPCPKNLTKDQITRTVKVLEMIQGGAADVYRRPDDG